MDPRLSPQGGPVAGGEVIIFEGHLEKISDMLAKWERRYFVLSRASLFESNSIELAYYKDSEKKPKQKKIIDLSIVTNVSPVQKPGNKEHVFALDMKGKRVLLRASSSLLQNVWVAKLLECCSRDHLTYHVTIPAQPMSSYLEGLIKLAAPAQVTIVSPVNGAQLVNIAFDKIRRFGCEVLVDYDIVWFETCGCKGTIEQFFWFSVPSGIEVAHLIAQDIKKSIELTVRSFLIQEEGTSDTCQIVYISRPHYGCTEFPVSMRQRILQSSLMSLGTSPQCEAAARMNRIERTRRCSGFSLGDTPTPGDHRRISHDSRRRTIESQLAVSPDSRGSVSPRSSPSPTHYGRTLNQMKYPKDLSKSAGHGDFDSGINMDGFDPSRHSAPCTYTVTDTSRSKKASLGEISKMMSLDERGSRPMLKKQRKVGTTTLSTGSGGKGRRLSDFATPSNTSSPRRLSDFSQNRDSANGSVGDLLDSSGRRSIPEEEEDGYNHLPQRDVREYNSKSLPGRSKKISSYDHLAEPSRNNAYDHLSETFGGMSLKSSLDASKKRSHAYVMS